MTTSTSGFSSRTTKELTWQCVEGCLACCMLAKDVAFVTPDEIFDDPDDVELYRSTIGEDGWCVNYNKDTRKCSIYTDRPYFCRVEPEVFKSLYGIEEKNFNKEACSDPRDADDAMYRLDGRDIDGSRIVVEFAKGVPRGSGSGSGSREISSSRGPPPGSGRCFNCVLDGHWARDCTAGDWKNKCYRCGDRGHIERNCKNSPKKLKRDGSYSRSPVRSRSRSPPRRRRDRSRSRSRSQSYSRSRSPVRTEKERTPEPAARSRSPEPTVHNSPPLKDTIHSPSPNDNSPMPENNGHSLSPQAQDNGNATNGQDHSPRDDEPSP